ncbi:Ecto-ADP-ribosyltransferase 5 [Labeo rohita]|uniref:NAD(P)(+)--arginine ADP-ribosyltransferase n=1 Tax=Labeo rohita TaxID=84645 RepID=A0ABQ8L7D1_LABRO|nr:Ecto-ADP-ribosyltransferase 5 [Labeo rohita]
MLLMIEALLLISAALQDRAAVADGKTLPLDMALNSVDDLYVGCKKNMAYRVETELLKNELSNSDFKEAWQKAEEDHKPPEDNLKEIHSTQAEEFGTKSCFEITTCEGANVTKYSALPIEKEVLIPPYEVFNVTEVKTRNVQEDLWPEHFVNITSNIVPPEATGEEASCVPYPALT